MRNMREIIQEASMTSPANEKKDLVGKMIKNIELVAYDFDAFVSKMNKDPNSEQLVTKMQKASKDLEDILFKLEKWSRW